MCVCVCVCVCGYITYLSVFFSATVVHAGLLVLLLLFSSVIFLEMMAAAAAALVFESSPPLTALDFSSVSQLTFATFLPKPPTFTTTVTACAAEAFSCTLSLAFGPLLMTMLVVTVFFSSSLGGLSDLKKLSLDFSVFATVVDFRGAATGLVLSDVVVVIDGVVMLDGVIVMIAGVVV